MARRRRSDVSPNPDPEAADPPQPSPNRASRALPGSEASADPRSSSAASAARARRRMEQGLEAIVAAVVQSAEDGNMKAAQLILDRLVPIESERPVCFPMRRIQSSQDAREAAADVLAAVAAGALTIDAAERVMKLLGDFIKTYAPQEFEARLEALEDAALVTP
jgi:hypothetical protein